MKEIKQYYVYIMTNRYNTVLYAGFSSGLEGRTFQHKHRLIPGFTTHYNINKLVYYEMTSDVMNAIAREKQIKGLFRKKKEALIGSMNSKWKDLSEDWNNGSPDEDSSPPSADSE